MQLNIATDAKGITALQTSKLALIITAEESIKTSFVNIKLTAAITTLIDHAHFVAPAFDYHLLVLFFILHYYFLF